MFFKESRLEFTGGKKSCVLVDGTIKTVSVAFIDLDTPFFVGRTEALCMPKPVYGVILGNIEGARNPADPDLNWVAQSVLNKPKAAQVEQSANSIPLSNAKQVNMVQTRAKGR